MRPRRCLSALSQHCAGDLRAGTQRRRSRAPETAGRRDDRFFAGYPACALIDAGASPACANVPASQSPGMAPSFALPDWNELRASTTRACRRVATALLIARDEYQDSTQTSTTRCCTDTRNRCVGRGDRFVAAEDAGDQPPPVRRARLQGNHDAYYDPRNSYLNEVRERRPRQSHFAGDGGDRRGAPARACRSTARPFRAFPRAPAGRRQPAW